MTTYIIKFQSGVVIKTNHSLLHAKRIATRCLQYGAGDVRIIDAVASHAAQYDCVVAFKKFWQQGNRFGWWSKWETVRSFGEES